MLKHSLLLTLRNAKRHKGTFIINLAGLSAGLTCVLLIFLWVNDELSVDRFHTNNDNLYQVWQNVPRGNGDILTTQSTPAILAQSLIDEFPEVEDATVSMRHWGGTKGILSVENNHFKASEQFVGENFFELFSFELLLGNQAQVLSDKYSIVLSEEMATKLFQSPEKSMGQTVEWNQGNYGGAYSGLYTVTGVFKSLPSNSTLQFDLLFSMERFLESRTWLISWANSDPSTYVLLKEGTNLDKVNEKIRDYRRSKYQETVGTDRLSSIGTLFFQRFSDNYLYNRFENGRQAGGRIDYVRLFSLIALFLIVLACINYINLSTAKASFRVKEIGVKRAIGVERKTLMFQFMIEALGLALLASVAALMFVYTLLPQFNQITGKNLSLVLNTRLVVATLITMLITGLVSGSYPALYLSRLKPVEVLKGKLPPSMGGTWIRKGLVVFQFAIAVILIVSVVAVHKQIEHIHTKNLGYEHANIITFPKEGPLNEKLGIFLDEIKNDPGVVNASSFSHNLTGQHGGVRGITWGGGNSDREQSFANLGVDYGLLELMEIEMAAGRPYSSEFGSDSSSIIFNEAAIAAMGIEDPIGKRIQFREKEYQIIGVTKDFHFESFYERIKPTVIQLRQYSRNVLIKIKPGMEEETIERIAGQYAEFTQGLPFEYRFLEDDYEVLYESENRVADLSRYFAFLAIVISCLGLFGLSVFRAEKRRKEVSIRKILGANTFSLVRLLSNDFTRLVGVAILVALPVSYKLMTLWLEGFAFRVDLPWWYFVGSGCVALIIAWITVGLQTLQAATINPVRWLKEE